MELHLERSGGNYENAKLCNHLSLKLLCDLSLDNEMYGMFHASTK